MLAPEASRTCTPIPSPKGTAPNQEAWVVGSVAEGLRSWWGRDSRRKKETVWLYVCINARIHIAV